MTQALVEQNGSISAATMRAILEQEMAAWKNTRYQLEVRLRVSKRIGDGDQAQAEIVKELERCEKALDCLGEELAALNPPGAA